MANQLNTVDKYVNSVQKSFKESVKGFIAKEHDGTVFIPCGEEEGIFFVSSAKDDEFTVLNELHPINEVLQAVNRFFPPETLGLANKDESFSLKAYKMLKTDKAFFLYDGESDGFIASPERGVMLMIRMWQWLVKTSYITASDINCTDKELAEVETLEKEMETGE